MSALLSAQSGVAMPTISEFYGITIRMYWKDHPPPHFHALYGEQDALVDVTTGAVIRGWLPTRARALVQEWTALHRRELENELEPMSRHATSREDRATAVGSPSPSAWRVVDVTVAGKTLLDVGFADGTRGEVRLASLLSSDRTTGSVFERLRDPGFFRQVGCSQGYVEWPGGPDLAPDAMYDAIRAQGYWEVD